MSTTTAVKPSTFDPLLAHAAISLRDRAKSLRVQADSLSAPLATAYRRRASELELEAWLDELQAGVPDEQIRPAA